MNVSIVGMYHTKFGKLENKNIYDLIIEAGAGALNSASVSPSEIGCIFIGNYSAGRFNNQEHLAPYSINIHPDFRFSSATRVENAGASGAAAIFAAVNAINAGITNHAMVIGVEKMTSTDSECITKTIAMASHYLSEGSQGVTLPHIFAEFASGYKSKYNISDDVLTNGLQTIACKNYKNALNNQCAHMKLDLTMDDIRNMPENKNPIIATPLRLHDCSLVSDGAVAIILSKNKHVKDNDKNRAVEIIAAAHTSDYLQMGKRKNYEFTASKIAIDKALNSCNLKIEDISFAEVHDSFTIAELLSYEALGIAKAGCALDILNDGVTQPCGRFPVNTSGGLKAKGHPIGASGVSMTVATALQLLGTPIGTTVSNPTHGLVLNFGGGAVSNYVMILKKYLD